MNSGKRQWQIPLGEYPELIAKGFRQLAQITMAVLL